MILEFLTNEQYNSTASAQRPSKVKKGVTLFTIFSFGEWLVIGD
jgi:hypothetical protein